MFYFLPILVIAGIVWLQIKLSKHPKKWPGLLLPLLCFLISIQAVFSLSVFHLTKQSTVVVDTTLEQTVTQSNSSTVSSSDWSFTDFLTMGLPIFVVRNVPTIVLLGIYYGVRKKEGTSSELEQMKLQDLE